MTPTPIPHNDQVIYDFMDQSPRWSSALLLFGIAMVGLFLMVSTLRKKSQNRRAGLPTAQNPAKIINGFIMLVLGFVLSVWVLNLPDYMETRRRYKKQEFLVVAGPVSDLRIHTKGKNDHMEFSVQGRRFRFDSNSLIHYGCRYPDIEDAGIQDSTFLIIDFIFKGHENIALHIKKRLDN